MKNTNNEYLNFLDLNRINNLYQNKKIQEKQNNKTTIIEDNNN